VDRRPLVYRHGLLFGDTAEGGREVNDGADAIQHMRESVAVAQVALADVGPTRSKRLGPHGISSQHADR
jgi:hypothetical protein